MINDLYFCMMGINFFGIIILLGICAMTVYFWKKTRLIANFLLGGLILIGLSHLDFLGFGGKLGVLSAFCMMCGYLGLNLTYIFYLINKRSEWHKIYAACFSVFALFFCFVFVDYGKMYEFKTGMLVRVFAAFFPIYIFTLKNERKNRT